jgi:hypothetical protein
MNDRKDALKDYVEVNVRIEKFYDKYPDGRIITDLISWNDGVVVMKAFVYKDHETDKPIATGMAYEKEGSSFINKTSALENCETSAVGRALAMAGFEIKKSIASKEEVANAKLNQNNPAPPKNDEQEDKSKLLVVLSKWETLGGTKESFAAWLMTNKQKQITELTVSDIDTIEQSLTKKIMEKKGA